jgi:hypothetical protein
MKRRQKNTKLVAASVGTVIICVKKEARRTKTRTALLLFSRITSSLQGVGVLAVWRQRWSFWMYRW